MILRGSPGCSAGPYFFFLPSKLPQFNPSHPFPLPPWAEHLIALECCFVMGVDLSEKQHAKPLEMFFQGLGAVPYLLHPENISWQAGCCGAELPREGGDKRQDTREPEV